MDFNCAWLCVLFRFDLWTCFCCRSFFFLQKSNFFPDFSHAFCQGNKSLSETRNEQKRENFFSQLLFLFFWSSYRVHFANSFGQITKVRIMDMDMFKLVKLGYGALVLGLSQSPLLPQLPQKNDARFKSGQNWL